MPGDVSSPDGGEPKDDADSHGRPEKRPEQIEQVAGAFLLRERQRHPERGERHRETEDDQDPGLHVDATRGEASAYAHGELERAEEGVADGCPDVYDDRGR